MSPLSYPRPIVGLDQGELRRPGSVFQFVLREADPEIEALDVYLMIDHT